MSYIFSGEGRYFIENTFYPIKKGSIFLINHKEVHQIVSRNADRALLVFPSSIVKQIPQNSDIKPDSLFINRPKNKTNLVLLDNEERIEIEFLISKLLIEFNGKRHGYQASCIGYFGVLLVIIQRAFLREHERDHVFTATENLVKDMAEFIDKNIKEDLSLDKLAYQAGVNPTYFSTIFKKVTGISLTTYINLKRLNIAKELLKNTNLKISAVSLDAGFNDLSHFNRVFRKEMSIPPLQYRKICKE